MTALNGLPLNRTHLPDATMVCISNGNETIEEPVGPASTVSLSVGIHGRAFCLGGGVGEWQNERVLASPLRSVEFVVGQ